MPIFRVLRKSDNKTVYAYSADASIEFPELPFADFLHVEEIHVNPDRTIDPDVQWRITKLAFRQRFTTQEKAGIEIAALDNPAATIEQRGLSAMLRANQEDVQAATYIDLKRADTRAGVMALEQFGLIGVGRAAAILDTPPTAEERYA